MLGKPGRLQIDLAFRNLLRQRAIQFGQRTIRAEQLSPPHRPRSIAPLPLRQLPRHEIERVDADAKLEGVVALDDGGNLVAEEIRDRLDQFGGCRFVLHVISPAGPAAAANRFPSPRTDGRAWRAPSNDPAQSESAASCRST